MMRVWRQLAWYFQRRRKEAELLEELDFHLAAEEEELDEIRGSSADSERQARLDLGNIALVREEVRAAWGWRFADSLAHDFRYAARRLASTPGFTLVAILILGLGIGANVAIFSLAYNVLVRPLPFDDPEQLVAIWGDASYRGVDRSEVAPAEFRYWQESAETFAGMALYSYGTSLTLRDLDMPRSVRVQPVGTNLFGLLGVQPIIGRAFLEEEGLLTAGDVAIVSHNFWQSHFGGRVELGDAMLDGVDARYSVVGVMPQGFQFGSPAPDIWVPLRLSPGEWEERSGFLLAVGRLDRGIQREEAQAEMDTLAAIDPSGNANRGVRLIPLHSELARGVEFTYVLLLVAAASLLVVASLNVAQLVLLRGARRKHELAVRRSIGATRGRLVQQLLTESILLATIGAVAGLVLSQWTFTGLSRLIPSGMTDVTRLSVDAPTLAFAVLATVVSGCLAGFAPALSLSTARLSSLLGSGRIISKRSRRIRNTLVTSQIAVATVVVAASGLFVGTLIQLQAIDPGFDPENLLAVDFGPRTPAYYATVLDRTSAQPGVSAAGISTVRPLTAFPGRRRLTVESYNGAAAEDEPRALFRTASRGYFEALSLPLLAGRFLDDGDRAGTLPVALVNEAMARQYWPDRDPVGERVKLGEASSDNPWYTVIGVVGDVRQRALDIPAEPEITLPYQQYEGPYSPRTIMVRTSGEGAVIDMIRRQVQSIDPTTPIMVEAMGSVAAAGLASRRTRAALLSSLAALTLGLSILGVYALVAFTVTDRTREIGLRLALGATSGMVTKMVLREGMALALAGCGIGLLLAIAFTRMLDSVLYGVTPTEPLILGGTAILIMLSLALASFVPCRRIARSRPSEALRTE